MLRQVVFGAETKSILRIWVPLWGGFCGTWVTVFVGTTSDILTSVWRKRTYGGTSATIVTGTMSASHTRFRW